MKRWARLTWPWGLFVAGVLLGTPIGELPDNTPRFRGGYQVLDGDFHVHTRFSDGFLSPLDVVLLARRKRLDVIGLTEHNMIVPGKMARWFADLAGGPVVIPGEEITTRSYHLIALGLDEVVPGGLPVERAIARVHEQGGVAIAAHPVQRYWDVFDPVRDRLDGMEVVHPIALRDGDARGSNWRWRDMVRYYERAQSEGHSIAAIGSSDYHFFSALGAVRTWVFATGATAPEVLDAIRAGRTVTRAPNGEVFGDPALAALLEREPLPERQEAPAYDATSAFDAFARLLAWGGLVALVVFRRASR